MNALARRLPLFALVLAGCSSVPQLDEARLVDLTYSFNRSTVYWPTARSFELERVAWGRDEAGRWYASNDFSASEHGGTHLDAPVHFAEGRRSTADIPVRQLVGPARVLDVRDKCRTDRDYLLSAEDVAVHERRHGRIPPGAVVLVHTGFGARWPDRLRYLGCDEAGRTDDLHFPGISPEAAEVFVRRRVDLVGIDTASLDHGPSTDFAAHRVLGEANVPGLENVAHLELLPPVGATILALPMKIEGGTGGPVRILALVP